ncbi:MAG TPA: Crp/Fnr family transcriptional regulator [Actinophytocola sp.]|uniref:Crp/Fnr family transcriptional regulator n=1 Tax=Actinophytocola sp. TaxID=1872138 RepID=UPI002DC0454D|nr:Crp/Fnr family transcriptional regulator [Actinophytocola sp.]HEU5470822.1 Crp/Fnr family transcriptional regulator [Actinophytocola sp.]
MAVDDSPVAGSLLAYLEATDRDFLLGLGVRRTFGVGEVLLRQGDPTDHALVLMSGWVRVFSSTANGHEILVALRGPGDVVGDQAALHVGPRVSTVQTLEPVVAMQLTSAQLRDSVRTRPNIAFAVIRQLAERLREAENARVDFAALDVAQRVAVFLLRLARQHGVVERDGLTLRMPLSQQDIANRIGASRRTVARSLAVLRERRVVSTHRRRIVIVQPDVLEALARSE